MGKIIVAKRVNRARTAQIEIEQEIRRSGGFSKDSSSS